jgi:hypothetical protein
MTAEYRVLDLFCGLGGFSQAFESSDRWAVTTVDIEPRFDPDIQADVFELRPSDFEQGFDVVLASPPCRTFSKAAGWLDHFQDGSPTTEDARDAIALAHHTVGLIRGLRPEYWYLENPLGSKIKAELGAPTGRVSYCQYGTDYWKATYLWGDHAPMPYRWCSQGDHCHDSGALEDDRDTRPLPRDSAERAKVPAALSEAIREAVDAALDGAVPEQTELPIAVADGGDRE